jgi:hypothetical protein
MRPRRTGLWIIAIVGATACGGSGSAADAARATDVVVVPSTVRLRAGEGMQLVAQANDSVGRPVGAADLAYAADTDAVIRVTSAGYVVARGRVGSDTVRVRSGALTRAVLVTVTAGAPRQIQVLSGSTQRGEVGTTLADPVAVRVDDAFGNPVSRASVHFESFGGGTLEPATAFTNPAGEARSVWTLGTVAGAQTAVASCDSITATFDATAAPGALAKVEQVGVPERRAHAADTVAVRLRAVDAHGNGVPGVATLFAVRQGGGSVQADHVETDAQGLVEGRWRLGRKVGVNELEARIRDVRDTTLHFMLRTVAGSAAGLTTVSGDRQRANAGAAVTVAPVVRVDDAFGNPVPSVHVRFAVVGGSGTVEPAEAVTDERGRAAVKRWTLGQPGPNILAVTVDGVPDTLRFSATARARPGG